MMYSPRPLLDCNIPPTHAQYDTYLARRDATSNKMSAKWQATPAFEVVEKEVWRGLKPCYQTATQRAYTFAFAKVFTRGTYTITANTGGELDKAFQNALVFYKENHIQQPIPAEDGNIDNE
eukprot:Lithocolla_globosa_v1_NODE_5813_length_1180_cov_3.852444.p1 type:complete len:121 gc:universal NODE_5813_length_1180_cov_3.852444:603-965(+)